ncbi:MAG TPA: hypothetical protein PLU11_10950, partial [Chitinophagaceae bacterium]|nr:hypothetical protein [Chitinophagaceae bacterium]
IPLADFNQPKRWRFFACGGPKEVKGEFKEKKEILIFVYRLQTLTNPNDGGFSPAAILKSLEV